MAEMQVKKFASPDERKTPAHGVVDVVSLGGVTVRRLTFQPGWSWSKSVKPFDKTEWCEKSHLNVHIAGRLKVAMSDGKEAEYGPGDISLLPPGHDAWVVGDDPVIIIEQTPPAA